MQSVFSDYYQAMTEMDRVVAQKVIDGALEQGSTPEELVLQVLSPAIVQFAEDFIGGEKSLSQHFLCSTITGEIVEDLLERFGSVGEWKGTVILGTAAGDFHGLGKKIVAGFLKSSLFEIVDLGINVSPRKFVDEALRHDNAVIGVSSMMVHTALGENGAKGVRRILDAEGLSNRIKLIVGGAPYKFDDTLWEETGADGWATDGKSALTVVRRLVAEMVPA